MKFNYLAATLLALCCICRLAYADELKTITLQDGSRIQGSVISLQNGEYTIQSPSLGTIHLKESNIRSISTQDSHVSAGNVEGSVDHTAEINNLMNGIMSNPELMNDIQALASDPQLVAILQDPAFMNAIQTRDFSALQTSAATQKLMDNPKMKALVQKIMALQQKK